MADKGNAEKLAAARKMLKEFQKKNRVDSSLKTPGTLKDNKETLMKTIETNQNHVYDSGTNKENVQQEMVSKKLLQENRVVLNGKHDQIDRPADNKAQEVGSVSKSNDQYVSELVSELKIQPVFSKDSSSSSKSIANEDVKSAKDFFDSLPVSSQSSLDFSFDTNNIDTSSVHPSNITDVPSVTQEYVNASLFDLKEAVQDFHSDFSESAVVTPSEPDRSEESSCAEQSKQISEVLELQLQEIDVKLGAEMDKNKVLQDQIQQSHAHINQLENNLEKLRMERDSRIAELEEKLQLHVKTLEILVAEKSELQTALTTCQESISQKAGEVEELQSRLRASRHRVGDVERELGLAQSLRQQQEKAAHEATLSRDMLKKEVDLIRKKLEESEEEVLSLRHKVEDKNKEMTSLKEELREKESQLSVSQLKIEQLGSTEGEENGETKLKDSITTLVRERDELANQVEQLNNNVQKMTHERDESIAHYQQYVSALHTQLETLIAKHENVSSQKEILERREASLVEHVSALEKQLQQTLQPKIQQNIPPQLNTELVEVKKHLESVNLEKITLMEEVEKLKTDNGRLIESLEESALNVEVLERKVERLEADRPDANLLQAAIESDKVAASRAVAQNTNLKKQLEELQDAFIKLSNNKLELTEKLEQEQHLSKDLSKKLEEVKLPVDKCEEVVGNEDKPCDVEKVDFCMQTTNFSAEPQLAVNTLTVEAMAKLEEKFNKKMQEVAELSDEKQRLEHLVLQLQGETETIGEYVALYQIQRGMLRQRVQEKDEQMAQLSQEKEILRCKLRELNHLVQSVLPNSQNHCDIIEETPAEEVQENTQEKEDTSVVTCPHHDMRLPDTIDKADTAGKIRALLTEIGSSKLVTSEGESTSFHSCPWCSGRLITV